MEWQAVEDDSATSDAVSCSHAEHSTSLLKGLNDLRNQALLFDVILRVDGKTFPANKCVLATFSPYFRVMFTSDMKESCEREVALKDIEPAVLESLLEFFYTGTISISQANVQSLAVASNLLQVLSVLDACTMFMAKHMDASNCLGIQCFAETMSCEKLQETARAFALNNFLDLAEHEEFLNLSRARLVELVSSDELDVPREEDVFTAVLKWFNHQPEARKDDFHKVLKCVRLPLMSYHFLHDFVSKQHRVRTRRCKQEIVQISRECVMLLQEALQYHLLPDRSGDKQSARTRPRRSNKLVDVLVCAGGYAEGSELRCLEAFDPVSNQWASLCDLPFPVSCHGAVATEQNTLYVAGGGTGNGMSNRLLQFDPQINKWQELASLSCARIALGLTMLDGFLYAVGGWDGSDSLASFERYNIETNQWEQLPALQTGILHHTVLVHDGYLYVAGGQHDDYSIIRRVQRFDPRTSTWTDMAPMLIPRNGSAGCVLDDKLYIIGGFSRGIGATNKVECYDVRNNQWSACSPMRARRECPGAAVMGGHIYVFGGGDDLGMRLNSVERYTPATDRWEDVPGMTMTSPRYMLKCAALRVGRSLLPSSKQ